MSDNVTQAIDGLTGAVTVVGTSLGGISAALLLIVSALQVVRLFEVALLFGILFFTFWQKDMVLFFVAGIITILIGAEWIDSYPGISIALWALGVYQILKGALLALIGTPARGLSQFKAMYNRARGR